MHRDQVFGVPAGAELLASTDICQNQGFVIADKVITVQGHPEFATDIMTELLESRHSMGLFTDDMFKDATKRNRQDHDGLLVARGFIRFLQQ